MRYKKGTPSDMWAGLAMMMVFGFLSFRITPFLIFPLVFAGFIPFMRGLTKHFERRRIESDNNPKIKAPKSKDEQERLILSIANKKGGKVSPSLVALETGLSIDVSQKLLDDLVKRGHASMEISQKGTVEYFFTDFLPNS